MLGEEQKLHVDPSPLRRMIELYLREMSKSMLQTDLKVTLLVYLNTYLAWLHTQTFEFFIFLSLSVFSH